jgi:hypothetical protein
MLHSFCASHVHVCGGFYSYIVFAAEVCMHEGAD